MARTIKKFVRVQKLQAELNQETINSFAIRVVNEPAKAFEWSNDSFRAFAFLQIRQIVIAQLDETEDCQPTMETLENLIARFQGRVITNATYPSHSTSPTSNLIAQYTLAAYAELLGLMQELRDDMNDR